MWLLWRFSTVWFLDPWHIYPKSQVQMENSLKSSAVIKRAKRCTWLSPVVLINSFHITSAHWMSLNISLTFFPSTYLSLFFFFLKMYVHVYLSIWHMCKFHQWPAKQVRLPRSGLTADCPDWILNLDAVGKQPVAPTTELPL